MSGRRNEVRLSAASPGPERIPRPASTETFYSEREVINMLDQLHRQKIRAESQVTNLQDQIDDLRRRLDESPRRSRHPLSPPTQPQPSSHLEDNEVEDINAGRTRRVVTIDNSLDQSEGEEPTSVAEEVSTSMDQAAQELEDVGSELDNFIRLRSYILHMQEGASLLLWREEGLQLCWFWLDKECLSLNWDVDESTTGEQDASGDSLLLERIIDIVPLGAGPDQLTDNPTDSSFTVMHNDGRIDIVAPTSLDFQVWYFGLAFATRLRLNALQSVDQSRSEALNSSERNDTGDLRSDEPYSDDGEQSGRMDARGLNATLMQMQEQQMIIDHLQRENQGLKEQRRSKDEAISRSSFPEPKLLYKHPERVTSLQVALGLAGCRGPQRGDAHGRGKDSRNKHGVREKLAPQGGVPGSEKKPETIPNCPAQGGKHERDVGATQGDTGRGVRRQVH